MIKNIIIPLLIAVLFISCNTQENKKLAKELYNTVYRRDINAVKKALKKGANPNYCLGEAGWVDSNPLSVIAESFYDIYYRKRFELIPNPIPDVAVLNILLEEGANIDQRPYIWERVFKYNNKNIESITRQRKADNESTEPEAMQEQIDIFMSDVNRLIEAFLKAGADSDKLGHPYPFSYEAVRARITEEQANEYFAQGTRAINVAIEKGIAWESQVDLLLQHTKLDEESLIAAERSNDHAMVEKINKLWEIQQKNSNVEVVF